MFTVELVPALLGLVHAVGEFGHLRHHVVEFGSLPLALHDDREHEAAGHHCP